MNRSFLFVLLAWAPATASADIVTLQNGVEVKGVITKETPQDVTVEVAPGGFTTFDRSQVLKVDKATADENKKIRADWKAQEDAVEKKSEDDRVFEERQHAKGLVKFEGEWLTKDEVDARLKEEGLETEREKARTPASSTSITIINARSEDSGGASVFWSPFPIESHRRGRAARRSAAITGNSQSRFNPVAPLGGIPPEWRRRSSDANRRLFGPNSGAQ